MMPAILSPSTSNSSLSFLTLLNGSVNVFFAKSSTIPGHSGIPKEASPDPALTSILSTWP